MGSPEEQIHAIDRLSPGQSEVLELVAQFKSSKEISRELGISHHTVDQRVKRIQAILGVATRSEAARVFVAAKGLNSDNELWGGLVYQSPELSAQPFSSIAGSSAGEWNPSGDGGTTELREAQAHYYASDFHKTAKPSWLSVLFEARRDNELTPTARTAAIAVIMLSSILSLSALIGLAEGMSRIF